ncbi:hypothetical protein M0R45_004677 [Rubus argutus]
MNVKDVSNLSDVSSVFSDLPESVKKVLLQSIFNNTGGEVVVNKDGKKRYWEYLRTLLCWRLAWHLVEIFKQCDKLLSL